LDKPSPADSKAIDGLARLQAHAAVLLLQLEEWDNQRGPLDKSEEIKADRVWALLRDSPDPRLRLLRSYLIHRFARAGVKPDVLLARCAVEKDASARRALLLSLGEFKDYQLPADAWKPLVQDYRKDPDPCIRSALEWLLRQWTQQARVEEIDRGLATGQVEEKRRWYVTARQGRT